MVLPLYHLHFTSLDSTNGHAKRHADQWNPLVITLLSADEQLKGYGRLGRRWHSPNSGNLYASYIRIVPPGICYLGNSAQSGAIAAAETVEKFTGCAIKLKWPNDLIANGGKCGGILVETVMRSDGLLCLIIGIGMNLNATMTELAAIDQPATSLASIAGREFSPSTFLTLLSERLSFWMELLFSSGFSAVQPAYLMRLQHARGDTLTLNTPKARFSGNFSKIDESGALHLLLSNGEEAIFHTGELIEGEDGISSVD